MDKHDKIKKAVPPYKWGGTTSQWEENTEKIARLEELAKKIEHDSKAKENE